MVSRISSLDGALPDHDGARAIVLAVEDSNHRLGNRIHLPLNRISRGQGELITTRALWR